MITTRKPSKLHLRSLVPCAMCLSLAGRNIWRNKRRSLITMASILFAVFFSIVMCGFQLGSYRKMVDNVVQAYTGYIQVFDSKYQSDKVKPDRDGGHGLRDLRRSVFDSCIQWDERPPDERGINQGIFIHSDT